MSYTLGNVYYSGGGWDGLVDGLKPLELNVVQREVVVVRDDEVWYQLYVLVRRDEVNHYFEYRSERKAPE